MNDWFNLEEAVRQKAMTVLEQRSSEVEDLGLRITLELERWSQDGRANSEIRIVFWRGEKFVNTIEDFIVRAGRPVASSDEFSVWLVQCIDQALEEVRADQHPG